MTDVTLAVMADPRRVAAAEALCAATGASLVLDADGRGENHTGDRAWRTAATQGHWSVVLQDDAVPVDGFAEQLRLVLDAAPSPVVSLYQGTGYPPRVQAAFRRAQVRADAARSPWIVTRSLFWGVGVAIRTDLVPAMLRAVRFSWLPYDQRISQWCRSAGHLVSYCWPSLVDHADTESLLGHDRALPRRAFRVGVRRTWALRPVKL